MPEAYEKISPTAVLVAAMRARYTDMPYASDIYEAVRGTSRPFFRRTPAAVLKLMARLAPRSMTRLIYLEARYLALNQALEELGDSYAVIEIAAGLSPRALERRFKTSTYIETDLPDMLATKQKIIEKILAEKNLSLSPNHHFYALNALDAGAWEELGERFLGAAGGNVAVIHEGLAQYLTVEEKCRLRDNITAFLKRYARQGLWITTDFYPVAGAKSFWFLRWVDRRIEKKTERKYHQFRTTEEIMQFMQRGGFKASLRDCTFIADRLTCVHKVGLDARLALGVAHFHKLCSAAPVEAK